MCLKQQEKQEKKAHLSFRWEIGVFDYNFKKNIKKLKYMLMLVKLIKKIK